MTGISTYNVTPFHDFVEGLGVALFARNEIGARRTEKPTPDPSRKAGKGVRMR